MKNYKRAKRRQDLAKKVKQRIRRINDGQFYYWMKSTSTPCSCDICTYYKYKKERAKNNRKAQKEIEEELKNN